MNKLRLEAIIYSKMGKGDVRLRAFVPSYRAASKSYLAFIVEYSLSVGECSDGHIYCDGVKIAYVSFNGKVWKYHEGEWEQDDILYNPYRQEKLNGCTEMVIHHATQGALLSSWHNRMSYDLPPFRGIRPPGMLARFFNFLLECRRVLFYGDDECDKDK